MPICRKRQAVSERKARQAFLGDGLRSPILFVFYTELQVLLRTACPLVGSGKQSQNKKPCKQWSTLSSQLLVQ